MHHSIKKLLRPLYITVLVIAMLVPMVLPAGAADSGVYSASDYLVEYIISHEGFVSTPMYDYGNNSVGYGFNFDYAASILPEVGQRGSITEEEALYVLKTMIREVFEPTLNSFLQKENIVVNQNQYNALIDLTYNIPEWISYVNDDGTRCLLVQRLMEGPSAWTEENIHEAFGKWCKAGGVPLEGLSRIRRQEAELFLDPETRYSSNPEFYSLGETAPVLETPVYTPVPRSMDLQRSTRFTDVPEDEWYHSYVMAVYEKKLMQGNGDGTFAPEKTLTRAELIQTFANFYGVDLSGFPGKVTVFTDVPQNAWYAPAIEWGLYYKLIQPQTSEFKPEQEVTREELCVYLARFLSVYNTSAVRDPLVFHDTASMSPTAKSALNYCTARGILDGVGYGYFCPEETVDRAQIAKILLTMDELVNG